MFVHTSPIPSESAGTHGWEWTIISKNNNEHCEDKITTKMGHFLLDLEMPKSEIFDCLDFYDFTT